jgi:hypothetical protein
MLDPENQGRNGVLKRKCYIVRVLWENRHFRVILGKKSIAHIFEAYKIMKIFQNLTRKAGSDRK